MSRRICGKYCLMGQLIFSNYPSMCYPLCSGTSCYIYCVNQSSLSQSLHGPVFVFDLCAVIVLLLPLSLPSVGPRKVRTAEGAQPLPQWRSRPSAPFPADRVGYIKFANRRGAALGDGGRRGQRSRVPCTVSVDGAGLLRHRRRRRHLHRRHSQICSAASPRICAAARCRAPSPPATPSLAGVDLR